MKRRIRWALLLGIVAALSVGVTGAAASHVYVNDFEQPGDDTAARGWTFNPPVRTPSGYVSPTGYASGVLSAHGRWHGRLKTLLEPCIDCLGAFNTLGTASGAGTFRPYVTEVDVYLDVGWTQTPTPKTDRRFDWSSAISDTAGNHRRDFVFNAGTDAIATDGFQPGFFVNASTNATRGGAFPQNPCPNPAQPPNSCRTPVHITQSGWYTFRHRFRSCNFLNTAYLAVDFTILRHNALVASWTICAAAPTDTIATTGRDQYGWFVINEINDLAIDCVIRRPASGFGHPSLGAPCRFEVEDECPDDDDDNDGLTNENETLLLTLPLTADSDMDGIKDGNDDSNGNGEDDEDEDDDDDPCPNDSDHDGEDDEDEDDDDDDDD